ncbi:MAG: apolipoprotein N-acyltransferase [Candidatus Nanopelagicales bacterium]|nr:apolipoprotein N-acyltransferase [Candidatus Nanopelagicales bacterium]
MKRILLAVAAGIAQFASFPPVGWWWTSPLGVALLVWAVRDTTLKRSALLGLLSGWAFFLPLLHWLSVLGWDAWLALSLVMGLWFALLAVMVNLALGTTWWVLGVPAVWMLQEWARSRFPWGGLGWGRLAFGQPDSPLTGWVSLGGAPLLGFAVALAGCLLLALVASRRGAFIAIGGICALVIVGLVVRPGTTTQESPATSQLAVVQGNVAQPGIDFLGRSLQVLGNHQRATVELAAAVQLGDEPQPDAVIWPENSADIDPVARPEARELVDSAARAIDAPILVGTVQEVPGQPDRVANVGLVWDPVQGPTDAYIKQHPVPFGEFLPMRPLLSRFITRFDRVPRDFIAGDQPGVLQLGPARIADVICFEISSDEIVRTGVREGGRALVVQTNNATFATTAQPEQQFDISRLRARETGRTVLVAATTGVTAVVTPDGSFQTLPQLTSGWINAEVSLRDSWTPAVRFGGLIDAALGIMGLVAVAAGLWVRRHRGEPAG